VTPRGVAVSDSSSEISESSRSRSSNAGLIAPVVAQLRTLRSDAPAAVAIAFCVNPIRSSARTMSFAATARRTVAERVGESDRLCLSQ